MKTSARNQFAGPVIAIKEGVVDTEVTVQLTPTPLPTETATETATATDTPRPTARPVTATVRPVLPRHGNRPARDWTLPCRSTVTPRCRRSTPGTVRISARSKAPVLPCSPPVRLAINPADERSRPR